MHERNYKLKRIENCTQCERDKTTMYAYDFKNTGSIDFY